MRNILIILTVLFTSLLCGCNEQIASKDFYYSNTAGIRNISSVTFVELYNLSAYPGIEKEISEELYHWLVKQHLFRLSFLPQSSAQWKSINHTAGTSLSLEQLYTLNQNINCDAILTGVITAFEPYPHLSISMQLELVSLKEGTVLWSAEQVWDGRDKSLETRVKQYAKAQIRSDGNLNRADLTFISTKDFIRFVCYELCETLESKH